MKYTKVIIVTLFCIGFVLGSVSLAFGQGGAPPYAGLNYEKIALLKWYAANQSGASFNVGTGPIGVAFDGANIWVTNSATTPSPSCGLRTAPNWERSTWVRDPEGVAFDGANIWVANFVRQTLLPRCGLPTAPSWGRSPWASSTHWRGL